MKLFIKMITLVLVALFIAGCTQSEPLPTEPLPTEPVPSDFSIGEAFYSWKPYPTVDELMQDTTNVFEGELINITFEAVKLTETDIELHTVYEFKASKSYKGWNLGTVRVGVPGGIEGYRVSEQYNTMVQAGIDKDDIRIYTVSGFTPPTVGENYLVVAGDSDRDFLSILTQYHFVFSPDEDNEVSRFGYQEVKEYCLQNVIPWGWIAVGVCVLGIVGAVYITYRRRKKKETGEESL